MLRVALHILHGMAVVALRFGSLDAAQRQRRIGWWSRGLLSAIGVRLVVNGELRAGANLLVVNHISWLDIAAVHAVCPHARFVSKSDVRHWPLLGWLIGAVGTLFIERERKRDALRVVHTSRRRWLPATQWPSFRKGRQATAVRCFHFTPIFCKRRSRTQRRCSR